MITTTLLEDINISFSEISNKIDNYRVRLNGSTSEFETNKYLENLISSQKVLKKRSLEIEKSLSALITKHY